MLSTPTTISEVITALRGPRFRVRTALWLTSIVGLAIMLSAVL